MANKILKTYQRPKGSNEMTFVGNGIRAFIKMNFDSWNGKKNKIRLITCFSCRSGQFKKANENKSFKLDLYISQFLCPNISANTDTYAWDDRCSISTNSAQFFFLLFSPSLNNTKTNCFKSYKRTSYRGSKCLCCFVLRERKKKNKFLGLAQCALKELLFCRLSIVRSRW